MQWAYADGAGECCHICACVFRARFSHAFDTKEELADENGRDKTQQDSFLSVRGECVERRKAGFAGLKREGESSFSVLFVTLFLHAH